MRSLIIAVAGLTCALSSPAGEPVSAPDEAHLKSAADYSEARNGRTMVVMFDGKIVLERYANGGAADQRQMLASGSKSFVGVAAAAAVEDRFIALDDQVSGAIADWKEDPLKSKITYRQLLTLTSGLTAGEPGTELRPPAWKEISAKPMTGQPGEQFRYGAYQLNTCAYALELKLPDGEGFEAYLKRRILDPLGVTVEWQWRCKDGHPQVGSGAFMTARDWARFGEFIRLGGRVGDKQIVDSKLLAECFHGTAKNPAYGLTWWLKQPVGEDVLKAQPLLRRVWGPVTAAVWIPGDMVAACGAGNQRLYVIPSQKLVMVRQGKMDWSFSDIELLGRLLGKETNVAPPAKPGDDEGH